MAITMLGSKHLKITFKYFTCFRKCPFVCWLVCQQDYTKTAEPISIKISWRTDLGQEQTPLTWGGDLNQGTDQGICSHFPLQSEGWFQVLYSGGWYLCVSNLMRIQIKIILPQHNGEYGFHLHCFVDLVVSRYRSGDHKLWFSTFRIWA